MRITQGVLTYTLLAPNVDSQRRLSQIVDARGLVTKFVHGTYTLTSKTEAFGTALARTTCAELKEKKCNDPKSPRDAGTFTWNCRDWAEWDGN